MSSSIQARKCDYHFPLAAPADEKAIDALYVFLVPKGVALAEFDDARGSGHERSGHAVLEKKHCGK